MYSFDFYIKNILKGILWVIPVVTLFISTQALFPYIAPRAFLFRILIGTAFALYIYLAIQYKEYRPRFSYIYLSFLILLIVTFVADIFGIHPERSIWSTYEKMGGFISLLYFGIYFLLLSTVFKTKQDWRYFFISCITVGLIHTAISLLQLPGVEILETYNNSKRAQGALGNPLYLGLVSTSLIFISLYTAFTSPTKESRLFFISTSFLFFILSLFTGSRSVLLALGVVSLFLIPLLWTGIKNHKKIFISILIAILGSIYIGFLINPRLLSLENKTIAPRFALWEIAFDAFKERPVLGWGEESFLTIFSPHYKSPEVNEGVWFDRTHTIFLEQLTSTGLLGTLAFIIFIGSILVVIVRNKNTDNKIHILWLLFIISYYTQLQVAFETLNSGILLYAVIAFANRSQQGFKEEVEILESNQKKYRAICALIACLFLVYITNIPPYIQNTSIVKNSIASAILPTDKLEEAWNKTISYSNIHAHDARERMSLVVNTLNQRTDLSGQEITDFTKKSRLELLTEIEKNPLNYKLKVLLLNIDLILIKHDPLFVTEIEKDIIEARKNAPDMVILKNISERIRRQIKTNL